MDVAQAIRDSGVEAPTPRPAIPWRQQTRQYALLATPWQRPTTRFLIFAQGRTGSTLLTKILSPGSQMLCDREILDRRVAMPTLWPLVKARQAGVPVYGFKVKIYQLAIEQRVDPAHWLATMDGRGWNVIYLRRGNVARTVLSNFIRNATDRSHRRQGEHWSPPRITVDPVVFRRYAEGRALLHEAEAEALQSVRHCVVDYEADLLDADAHQATLDRVSDFLGLTRVALRPPELRRTSSDDLRSMVANHEELRRSLIGTPWEGDFELDA